ncbi:hypothetical protein CEXT_71391 [Caerostris extrusa]|uniref:PDEase domain-containing protein n=1 Tax=Caerostris extrusa TaxID=172846 RepID=A0AAV4WIN3_CAEEX|nr:hypothetical protein CEXT_71391 [Caerostris extrusa]
MNIIKTLNSEDWSFDVFQLNSVAGGQCLRYMSHYLLNRFGLINKFKMSTSALESFLDANRKWLRAVQEPLPQQHARRRCHANCRLFTLPSRPRSIIHDYEHTGTTNSFHVMSGSETALLYNDRCQSWRTTTSVSLSVC